ncbi:MAG TPA: hypothetical protein VKM72_17635 [Thermoanaerobaculia bacterium]|nr:hypothetical protein [Thermoanaerobaculia bacterium]
MKEIATKLLEQGLPTLLFVLAAICLGLGFFDIKSFSPFSYTQRLYAELLVVALVLLIVSIGLWLIDRKKAPDAQKAIEGHYVLIRLLERFSQVHDFRPPSLFASVTANGEEPSLVALRATQYGVMYLHSLGLLEANANGSEYRTTAKADALLKDDEFRSRNAGALNNVQGV